MNVRFGKSRSREPDDRSRKASRKGSDSDEPMVIRHLQPDGSVRYEVTDALLEHAAEAASRKKLEAA